MARVPQVNDLRAQGGRTVETSESRITIRETLDGLGIHNPARRKAGLILFMMVWLAGWAFGEYFALSEILRGGNVVGSTFLLVWLTIWTLGGLFAMRVLAWNLFGSERLFITDGMLVHSRGFGPFQRKRVYPVGEIDGFRLDLRGDPATNAIPLGSLEYKARGERRLFGIAMTREEAEASLAAIRRALPLLEETSDAPSAAADS